MCPDSDTQTPLTDLLPMLAGGDRRSIGQANRAAAIALAQPGAMAVLMQGMAGADPVVRMRCADAAEKASAVQPGLLLAHRQALLAAALARGWAVRGLVRNPQTLACASQATPAGRLLLVPGELSDSARVRQTLQGADAVCCLFGPRAPYTDVFCADGTAQVVGGMQQQGIIHPMNADNLLTQVCDANGGHLQSASASGDAG